MGVSKRGNKTKKETRHDFKKVEIFQHYAARQLRHRHPDSHFLSHILLSQEWKMLAHVRQTGGSDGNDST